MRYIKTLFIGIGSFGLGVVGASVFYKKIIQDMEDEIEQLVKEVTSMTAEQLIAEAKVEKSKKESSDLKEYKRRVTNYNKPALEVISRADLEEKTEEGLEVEEGDNEGVNQFEEGTNAPVEESIHLITEEEYLDESSRYDKAVVHYYQIDDVLTDDNDESIEPGMRLKVLATPAIERKVKDNKRVWVRNNDLDIEYEVYCINARYADIAYETPIERTKRLSKRAFRDR